MNKEEVQLSTSYSSTPGKYVESLVFVITERRITWLWLSQFSMLKSNVSRLRPHVHREHHSNTLKSLLKTLNQFLLFPVRGREVPFRPHSNHQRTSINFYKSSVLRSNWLILGGNYCQEEEQQHHSCAVQRQKVFSSDPKKQFHVFTWWFEFFSFTSDDFSYLASTLCSARLILMW